MISTAERIKRNVSINEATGCWEWQGSKKRGYGHTIIGSRTDGTRKTVAAHRLSYETFVGPIPDGMEVCHKCDNPCCVNPEHLFVGTRQDNIDDREAKGRNNPPQGSRHSKAKLTETDVLSARFERFHKNTSYQKLADKYGVSKKTIQNAIKGRTWMCVAYMPNPPKEDA
jgi:hypothetical protein